MNKWKSEHFVNSVTCNYVVATVMMIVDWSSGAVLASDIHKWTDEQGNVHFGDRPTNEVVEEPLAARFILAEFSVDQAHDDVQATVSKPSDAKPDHIRALDPEQEDKCAGARARIGELLISRDSYRNDDEQRVEIEEEEILAARENARNQVEEFCKI